MYKAGLRMEETLQQEKQESEYKNPNEDQGGIRRRLRDRDLLRKRKAEAEEKETNQWVFGVESQRKRARAEDKTGSKKRGRPRKTEPTSELSVIQEKQAVPQEAPAVMVVPEPAEAFPEQTSGSLSPFLALESQAASVLAAPAPLPVFGSVQSPVFAPTMTSPAPVNPTPAFFSPAVPAPSPTKVLDTAPIPVQDSAPAPDAVQIPFLIQAPVPAAATTPPSAPPQVETLYKESQEREAQDLVLIEDLGPDEEVDKRADEDLSETPSINIPEQNKMFSIPTMSSPPPPQEYLPGNSF
ncbi:vegetative cell wall protein gp1 isoform X4 [Micropterus dolomieu]|uniref:vegetative cell wall protein gp1 isoform X4 n=1 Tax=Micropterus dolomieu TaxID=147949 RepID=UPI001E8E8437|nr:vegetative cell wall protein gp1 isoform X4 [Micropterus dolomieu]